MYFQNETGLINWNYQERGEKSTGGESIRSQVEPDKMLAPLNDQWSPEKFKKGNVESTPILHPRRISFSRKEDQGEIRKERSYVNVEEAWTVKGTKNEDFDKTGENDGERADNVTVVNVEEDLKWMEQNCVNTEHIFEEFKTLNVSEAIAHVARIQENGDKALELVLEKLEGDVRKEKEEAAELSARIKELAVKDGNVRGSARIISSNQKKELSARSKELGVKDGNVRGSARISSRNQKKELCARIKELAVKDGNVRGSARIMSRNQKKS